MATQLIPEILALIFAAEETKIEDLKNYSLVSSTWYPLAQRELFRSSTFVIKRLDSPAPQSISYSTLVENDRYRFLGFNVRKLRIGLEDLGRIDPKFPDFLRRLTQIQTIYLTNKTGYLLFQGAPTQEICSALIHLFHSTTLTKLFTNTGEFPVWVLRSCTHLRSLSCTFPSEFISTIDPLKDSGSSTSQIEEIYLTGAGGTIRSFGNWLHGFHDVVSMNKVQRATLEFINVPFNLGNLFMEFTSLTHLVIKADETLVDTSNLDFSHLTNLTTFAIKTTTVPSAMEPGPQALSAAVTWTQSLVSSMPLHNKLQTVELSLLGTYNINPHYSNSAMALVDALLGRLNQSLLQRCSRLSTLSLFASWLSREDLTRNFSRLSAAGVSLRGPNRPIDP